MPVEAFLALAGGGGLLLALVAWLIYSAGRKDVQLQQEQDNAAARKESDRKADNLARASDADINSRVDRL